MAGATMDQTDKELLNCLQAGFTIVAEPYAALGRRLGVTEAEVLERIRALRAARVIRHPGVSHNYKRNHVYNMWYTLTVPPHIDIEQEISWIHAESGAEDTFYETRPSLRT